MAQKVALITGGSSGIGKAIATTLAAKGYTVYGTSRKATHGDVLDNFKLVQLDVTDEASVKSAVDYVLTAEGRIDVLVNNAGIGIIGALEDTTVEQCMAVLETNFLGMMRVTTTVLPTMRQQQSGYVINISSVAGQMGLPYRGIYSVSKSAVEMYTEALSMEVKQFGLKVCMILPGDFATNISSGRVEVKGKEGSPYTKEVQRLQDSINAEVKSSGDPAVVGELVHKIVNTNRPKLRYVVGSFMQKLSPIIKKFVSGRRFEKMLMKHYKMK